MKTPFLKNPVPVTADDAPVDADALLAEFDRESNTRHFSGIPRKLIRYMLAAFTLFVLYMNLIPSWPEQIRRAAFVGLIVFMAFMLFPANRKAPKKPNYIPWYDFVLAIVGAGTYFYFIFNFDALMKRASRIQPLEIVLGIIGILILAEVCRRAVGVPILVVGALRRRLDGGELVRGQPTELPGQHLGARLGQFIEDQTRAPALGLNGE